MNPFEKMFARPSGEKKKSQKDNQLEDPSKREFLGKIFKLGAAAAAIPLANKLEKTAGFLNSEAHAAERNEQTTYNFLKEIARETGADQILKKPPYLDAQKYSDINALYETFDDQDIRQSVAMAVKMIECIDVSEEVVSEDKMERIFQQGGFLIQHALRQYKETVLSQKESTSTKTLQDFLSSLEKSSAYYTESAKRDQNPFDDKEKRTLDRTFMGITDLNNLALDLSSQILAQGETAQDMQIAAQLRALARKNVQLFQDRKISTDFGDGKVLLLNKAEAFQLIENFVYHIIPNGAEAFLKNNASVQFFPGEVAVYLNGAGQKDQRLADFMLASGAIRKKADGKYERVDKALSIFIATKADHFVHENQHCEFVKNPAIIRRFVGIWNKQTPLELKKKLLDEVLDYGYTNLSPEERNTLLNGQVNAEEILSTNRKQVEGIKITGQEERLYTVMTEFFAYSTDNKESWFYNEMFESKDQKK